MSQDSILEAVNYDRDYSLLQKFNIPVFIHRSVLTSAKLSRYCGKAYREYGFLLVEDGSLHMRIEDESFDVNSGELVFINFDKRVNANIDEGKEVHICVLLIHPSALFEVGLNNLAVLYSNPLTNPNSSRSFLKCDTTDSSYGSSMLTHFNRIGDLLNEKAQGYELIVKGELYFLWHDLYKACHAYSEEPARFSQQYLNDNKRITTAMLYIDVHYQENISLDDISANLNVSKSECCRCFNRILHLSPIEYLIQYRIITAAKLLSDPRNPMTIATIATSVGFNNVSYFNKAFKAQMGITPSQYRKQHS
ncbi:MAG: AraC family transcriptional regulator [Lachnospiraceae bacterium]|nr:AraC family transcriptional regulator [Lachnospiraceae bacterium]